MNEQPITELSLVFAVRPSHERTVNACCQGAALTCYSGRADPPSAARPIIRLF